MKVQFAWDYSVTSFDAPRRMRASPLCGDASSGGQSLIAAERRSAFDAERRTSVNVPCLPSPRPRLVARSAFDHLLDPPHRDAGQPLRRDPNHVRVVLAPPVTESECQGVITWGAMAAKVSVATPYDFVFRERLLNH